MCVFMKIKPVIEGERGNNETRELTGTRGRAHQGGQVYISGHETFHYIVRGIGPETSQF